MVSLQSMVIGVHGSRGECALLPVEVERAHVSGSVTVHLLVAVVAHVQETPPSCPGVTLRPVPVSNVFRITEIFNIICIIMHHLLKVPPLFVRWAP